MSNVNNPGLALNSSIEYYIKHWKYGINYEDSTILVDSSYNIIAFFDRGTENIDTIQSEIPTPGGFIIVNGEGIEVEGKIKYRPFNKEESRKIYGVELNRLKQKGFKKQYDELIEKILDEIKNYNINYFKNLKLNYAK